MNDEIDVGGSVQGTIVMSPTPSSASPLPRPCVTDAQAVHELVEKGFGWTDRQNDGGDGGADARLFLESFEALYLMHTDRLTLFRSKRLLTFEAFLSMCRRHDPDVLTRFLIYRDLRSRGYVAKDGFGFGADFRVYERGHFGQKGSKILIFGLVEGRPEKMVHLQKKIREITKMGKEPIMAVVDRHGEIIYYRIGTVEFRENKGRVLQDLLR
ncbi:MAG: tRNA-intron lyase [Thaumarchaeota archaeon]|nr:tRNA-intron lyase [Nitrososphaerota archaeon]MDE0266365.1 tRNA-intron lyase [Nitrososphaerota archaeon]MDE0526132.1 tRNA-intron lyase [Nitrososphaerota archaeon]